MRTLPIFQHCRRAFTLVEVLVVVAILGIAGLIVVPSLSQAGQLGAQGAIRQVIADLLIAQNEAIATQRVHQLRFRPADAAGVARANAYRLEEADGTLLRRNVRGGGSAEWLIDFDAPGSSFVGVEVVRLAPAGATLIGFDELGSPTTADGSAHLTEIDLAFNGTTYRIQITPLTGRVTVERLAA